MIESYLFFFGGGGSVTHLISLIKVFIIHALLYQYTICYLFQDREIRSDDMTWILPSSQPILKETFHFSIMGLTNFTIFLFQSVILCLDIVTSNTCFLQVNRSHINISISTNDWFVVCHSTATFYDYESINRLIFLVIEWSGFLRDKI